MSGRTGRTAWAGVVMAGAMMLAATGAVAQGGFGSAAYDFLKAVKDRDGNKVQEALDKPGNTMLQARDENGETALHIVTKRRDTNWVNYMLAHGASPNIRDRQGNTPLMDAAQIAFSEGVAALLAGGANPNLGNDRGETPLILATVGHDFDSVRSLVQYGADPNQADHVAGLSAIDYAKRDTRSAAILKTLQEAKPKAQKQVSGPVLR